MAESASSIILRRLITSTGTILILSTADTRSFSKVWRTEPNRTVSQDRLACPSTLLANWHSSAPPSLNVDQLESVVAPENANRNEGWYQRVIHFSLRRCEEQLFRFARPIAGRTRKRRWLSSRSRCSRYTVSCAGIVRSLVRSSSSSSRRCNIRSISLTRDYATDCERFFFLLLVL